MDAIASAGVKVALSAAAVAAVLFKTRRIARADLGLAAPAWRPALAFVAIFLAWMLASDAAIHWRGPFDFAPWRETPLAAAIMRVLAVALIGPIAEELIFRGWLFHLVEKRFGPMPAIALTAIGWTVLHSYGWAVLVVIVVDGVLLGMARWRTGSVYVPIAMHALYNFYAVW